MKLVSTTALAKHKNIETNEMFKLLTENNWMFKKDDVWNLTAQGRMAGGDIKYNPKFGEYIVWPLNLDVEKNIDIKNTLSSTKIGEYFQISNRKINLYLSELGWIEKDKGGWICTPAGIKYGAIQMEAKNGKPYVIWENNIKENRHLIREIKGATGDSEYQDLEIESTETDDFRLKYPAKLRTPDGHLVRSRGEIMIDDFLYKNGIVHAYERRLNIDEEMYCDFYIPSEKLYIEYWGLEENEKYQARKKIKLELYSKYNFKLIEINNSDIENLDERLAAKLRKFNIIVD